MDAVKVVPAVAVRRPLAKARFVFTDSLDMALLYEVQLSGAHIQAPGKKQVLFDKVLDGFVKSHEYTAVEKNLPQPTWRTISDRLFKLVRDRRAFVRAMEKKSGVEEEFGDREKLLDALIKDIDRKKDADREEKNEKNARAEALREAGELTRAMATGDAASTGDSSSPPRKKTKTSMFGSNSASERLAATMERQQDLEEERLKLERDRFELAKKQQEALFDLIKSLVSKST